MHEDPYLSLSNIELNAKLDDTKSVHFVEILKTHKFVGPFATRLEADNFIEDQITLQIGDELIGE